MKELQYDYIRAANCKADGKKDSSDCRTHMLQSRSQLRKRLKVVLALFQALAKLEIE